MILAMALALGVATPVDTAAHGLADYTACLRLYAGRPNRDAAAERARFAAAQCRSQREAAIRLAMELIATPSTEESVRAQIEHAMASLDALFPAILAAGGGVEIPLPIAPQVRRYSDCLAERSEARVGTNTGDMRAYAAAVEPSIAACATVRNAMLAEAETVLSEIPEFSETGPRHEAIARAFDQTDAMQRNLLQILDAVSHGQATNAAN